MNLQLRLKLARLLALAAGASMAALSAQTVPAPGAAAPPPAVEDLVELSPFVVNTSRDTGYQASSTLAGTRLNTPIKDVAASISVYTDDFLKDIGATNSSDLLIYATGMDAAGPGGNFSAATNDMSEPRPTGQSARVDPQGSSRSRGLSSPTYTRGYFGTSIAFDSYNTGMVTVNRGPNSALFGVGSGAGIVDTALVQAELTKNKFTVSARYGNNDSLRASTDLNLILLPKTVALRVATLRDREKFNQRPAFENKDRVYAALTVRPTKTTALRANVETGHTRANRPIGVLPFQSAFQGWLDAGRPSYDWKFYDNLTDPSPTLHGTGTEGFFYGTTISLGPIWTYDRPTDTAPSRGFLYQTNSTTGTAANAVKAQVSNPVFNRNAPIADSIRFLHSVNIYELPAGYWTAANVKPGQQPGYAPAGIKMQGYTDYRAFDFRNHMIDESGRQNDSFRALNVKLEQNFWNNHAGLEAAYDSQRADRHHKNSFFSRDNANHIYVDVNVTLPNGETNPNVGRPYAIYGLANVGDFLERREAWHITSFLTYDFKELKAPWAKWLGRHTLTGLYEENRVDTIRDRIRGVVSGTAVDTFSTGDMSVTQRRASIISYIGPSVIGNNNPLRLESIRLPEIKRGPMIPVSYFSRAADATDPGRILQGDAFLDEINDAGSAQRELIKSQAAVLQSYWLGEHVITTASWRRDEDYNTTVSTTYVANPANRNDPGIARLGFDDLAIFSRSPPPYVNKEIKALGLVARWPQALVRLPLGSDVRVFANKSSNFTPVGGRITPFAESLPSPVGETKEFGFNFSTLRDKINLRMNFFETSIKGATGGSSNMTTWTVTSINNAAANWAREGNTNPQMVAQRNRDIELLYSVLPANFRDLYAIKVTGTAPNISVSGNLNTSLSGATDTTDFRAKGVEADLVYNPTNNWRILLNVAKQETIQTNQFPFMKRFVAMMRPVWDQLRNVPYSNYPTGYVPGTPLPVTTQTYGQWLDTNVYVPLATALATEGMASPEQRKWRANLVTNYRFGRGALFGEALRGWSVGGAARWQDRYALGYPTTRNADGSVFIDIRHPYRGETNLNIDLFLGYERDLFGKRIHWKAQLNVKNAFADSDPIPMGVQPWGEIAQVRLPPERRWYLTNTFGF
jgi:outer membrane receptor protein involved in Fe transport